MPSLCSLRGANQTLLHVLYELIFKIKNLNLVLPWLMEDSLVQWHNSSTWSRLTAVIVRVDLIIIIFASIRHTQYLEPELKSPGVSCHVSWGQNQHNIGISSMNIFLRNKRKPFSTLGFTENCFNIFANNREKSLLLTIFAHTSNVGCQLLTWVK